MVRSLLPSELKRQLKGKFLRNIATLVSGAAIAQIINLLFIPLITRLYGPEAFGVMGYYSSLLSFVSPLAALCYPLALVLPKQELETKVLFDISAKLAVLISLTFGTVFFVVDHFVDKLIPFQGSYIVIPVGMFLSFGVMAHTQLAIKKGKFKVISRAMIIVAVFGGVMKVVVGSFYPNAIILIIAAIIALLMNVLLINQKVGLRFNLHELVMLKNKHFIIARKYIRFPLYRMPHSVLAVLSQVVPVFFLTTFFGPKYAGYFALTRTVLAVPVTLIGKAVYDVSYPKINERYIQGVGNFNFVLKQTIFLAILSLLPLLVAFYKGEYIFLLVFGEEWKAAGVYAAWMSIWFAFNFSNKAVAAAVSVYELDGFLFRNGVLNIILSISGFLLGALYYRSDILAVAFFSLFGVVCQLLLISKVLVVIRKFETVGN